MLKEITKRDGSIVEFDPNKINLAIKKAFISARGESDDELIGKLTKAVVRYLKANVPEDTAKTTIEDVQDAVEHVLIKYNLPKVAKEYILYRDLHNLPILYALRESCIALCSIVPIYWLC